MGKHEKNIEHKRPRSYKRYVTTINGAEVTVVFKAEVKNKQ